MLGEYWNEKKGKILEEMDTRWSWYYFLEKQARLCIDEAVKRLWNYWSVTRRDFFFFPLPFPYSYSHFRFGTDWGSCRPSRRRLAVCLAGYSCLPCCWVSSTGKGKKKKREKFFQRHAVLVNALVCSSAASLIRVVHQGAGYTGVNSKLYLTTLSDFFIFFLRVVSTLDLIQGGHFLQSPFCLTLLKLSYTLIS